MAAVGEGFLLRVWKVVLAQEEAVQIALTTTRQVSLLEDQLTWAMERLPHDGVVPAHILNRLRIYREVVGETLPERHANEIEPYLTWMIARQKELLEERS